MSLGSGSNFFLGAASAGAGGYKIERSLRFNSADSAYLNRTPTSAGNRKTFTFSFWCKRTNLGTNNRRLFGIETTGGIQFNIMFASSNAFYVQGSTSGAAFALITSSVYRDVSAWYHIVVSFDTSQATESNRARIYINGSQVTEFSTATYPTQDILTAWNVAEPHYIGSLDSIGNGLADAYLADIHFIDGQALDPTDFGEFDDNGVWQPIEYAGTYGTNGFHLDFSDNSTAAALGTDVSGNGNDWTVNNITAAGDGTSYRSLEVIEPDPNGSVANIQALFNPTYIGNYINTSTWVITNTAWIGAYNSARDVLRWTPRGGYAVTSSFRVYYGCYDNTAKSTTLTITYTDASTETDSMTSGNNNWMKLFTTSNAAGKTIEKVELSIATPSATNLQFGAFVVDNQIVTSLNTDTDSFIDSPTNGTQTDTGAGGEVIGNYATLNPLQVNNTANPTFSNGNLEITDTGQSGYNNAFSTIGVSSGKWYVECTNEVGAFNFVGIQQGPVTGGFIGNDANGWGYTAEGYLKHNSSNKDYNSVTYGAGDIIGIALDLDSATKTLIFYKNGTSLGIAYSGSELDADVYHFGGTLYTTNDKQIWNFGQRLFAYAAPSGYKALCTANLPDPTIADGSTAMDTKLYTGTEATLTISGYNFAPDLVWRKGRQAVGGSITESPNNLLFDTVRGAGKRLISNNTSQEDTGSTTLTAFTSDGFTLGSSTDGNDAPQTYAAWAWDAGTSTVSNTDGTITSSVRANPSAGFSIVTYTGNGTAGATVGHGLGVKPAMIHVKRRDTSYDWISTFDNNGQIIRGYLNLTNAFSNESVAYTSSTFQLINSPGDNANNGSFVAYCFAPVEGYSSFGSYTGNGLADGPFVYTGFSPKFLLVKVSSGTNDNWFIQDTSRSPSNVSVNTLSPDNSNAESSGTFNSVDILSNGFKLRDSNQNFNGSTYTYIYAAFAENPFRTARAR